jgi:hypothetical protein
METKLVLSDLEHKGNVFHDRLGATGTESLR